MSNLTQRDNNQIERHEHDESIDAKRVYIVGGADIKVNADTSQIANSVASAVKEGLADLVPVMKLEPSSKTEVIVVKEPQIVEVEKQVVVTQKEIVYVDKPVIIEKTVYKEIEKPIVIKDGGVVEKKQTINPIVLACVVLQTLTIIGLIILKK
jgi:hypothetical protein